MDFGLEEEELGEGTGTEDDEVEGFVWEASEEEGEGAGRRYLNLTPILLR